MELYTSLVRLKQALGGGDLPPMTPVPESVHHIIDPEFTIGYGALAEDETKGLRCPVRGCGTWWQQLPRHLNKAHGDIGGAEGVKRALDIPYSARLMPKKHRDRIAEASRSNNAVARLHARPSRAAVATSHHRQSTLGAHKTTGAKNLINACRAQLTEKLTDLRDEIGHSPSSLESTAKYGAGFVAHVRNTFGTWGNALAQCGLDPVERNRHCKIPLDRVLEALRAYYEVHGDLPNAINGKKQRPETPLMPYDRTIKRVFEATTWPEAMRKAAVMLNIYGGQYGMPDAVRVYREEKARRSCEAA